ncbi:LPXTG cell wall anchor domain-containing protein [Cellulomonas sp. Marseille-Q8402]
MLAAGSSAGAGLATTGAEPGGALALAGLLLAGGVALVVLRRRSHRA